MANTPRRTIRETDARWNALDEAAILLKRAGSIDAATKQQVIDFALDAVFGSLGMDHVPRDNTNAHGDVTRFSWYKFPEWKHWYEAEDFPRMCCTSCGSVAFEARDVDQFCTRCGTDIWRKMERDEAFDLRYAYEEKQRESE